MNGVLTRELYFFEWLISHLWKSEHFESFRIVHHMLLLSSTANPGEEKKKETPEESEREEQTATRENEE